MSEPSSVVPRQRHDAHAHLAPIEQAKGMLMLGGRIGEDQAALLLERWSGEWGVPVRDVATTIVQTAVTGAAEVGDRVRRGV